MPGFAGSSFESRYPAYARWRNTLSLAEHGIEGLHKQAAIADMAIGYRRHVAVAACFIAEHRGFEGEDTEPDWLAA